MTLFTVPTYPPTMATHNEIYYLWFDDRSHGPYSGKQITVMRENQIIPDSALYCIEGAKDWTPIGDCFMAYQRSWNFRPMQTTTLILILAIGGIFSFYHQNRNSKPMEHEINKTTQQNEPSPRIISVLENIGFSKSEALRGAMACGQLASNAGISETEAALRMASICSDYNLQRSVKLTFFVTEIKKTSEGSGVPISKLLEGIHAIGNVAPNLGVEPPLAMSLVATLCSRSKCDGITAGLCIRFLLENLHNDYIEKRLEGSISFRTSTGYYRETREILGDLSLKFKELNEGDQTEFLKTIARNDPIHTAALLDNLTLAEALEVEALMSFEKEKQK